VHDFNPGIRRSGLFWTTQIRRDSVHVDVRDGEARMRVHALDIDDSFNLPNALFGDRKAPASVSFAVTWSSKVRRDRVRNDEQDFAGLFVTTDATMSFRARSKGVTYRSTDASTTAPYAALGHERNGRFFG
jgi:hypothetical protein